MKMNTRLHIGRGDRAVVIRVEGPGTALAATLLRPCVTGYRQPVVTDLYFDLESTPHVDSTFVGLLVWLAAGKSEPLMPRVHVIQPCGRVAEVLDCMHVRTLLDVQERLPFTVEHWADMDASCADTRAIAATVIDAHERLIAADPRNAEVFRGVIEGMRTAGGSLHGNRCG